MSSLNLNSNKEQEDDEYPEDRNDDAKMFHKINTAEMKEKVEVEYSFFFSVKFLNIFEILF